MKIRTERGFIDVEMHNEKSAVSVIFCIGFGETKRDKPNNILIKNLSRYYFTTAFDYLGLGKSSGKVKDLTTSGMVNDLGDVLKYLKSRFPKKNWKNLILIGWSHGTVVASIFASRNSVGKLILIGYDGFLDGKENEFSKSWKKLGYLPDVRYLNKGVLRINKALPISYRYHKDFRKFRAKEVLSKIKASNVLIIQGEKDQPDIVRKDFKCLKGKCELKTLKNVGHELKPGKVLPIIRKFSFN